LLFLGDDTTSAGAEVEIASVTVVSAPVLRVLGSATIEWDGIPGQTYTVETSSTSSQWTIQAQVHSATTTFTYTNAALVAQTRFLRVSHP
jgi:hypothetical protein